VYNLYNIKLLDHQPPFALVHVVPYPGIILLLEILDTVLQNMLPGTTCTDNRSQRGPHKWDACAEPGKESERYFLPFL